MKRKPAGEAALVDFTRRRFRPPDWIVALHSLGVKILRVDDPVKGEWILPKTSDDKSVVYYLHGGGYISGSAKTTRPITVPLARRSNRRVFALDYRLAPEHRFPAAVEDAVAGYRWLVASGIDPRFISVAGDSAGGGLAVALVMALRNRSDTLPCCVACMSPWTDMTGRGESIVANSERDSMFHGEDIGAYARVYLGSASPETTLASPVFGDFAGFPPLYLEVGESEVLKDDARQVHEKAVAAGVPSELRIVPGVPHGWQFGGPFVPEARESISKIAEFISRQ
ncbi:MAG TPA: alpha/beta hydrolase [Chthoniobacterales bacterium]|nr:alpha/beta hydrolase [Chthoniobacterales bacterium]